MADIPLVKYVASGNETFAQIAQKVGADPLDLYLQNADALLVPGSADTYEGPPIERLVRLAFEVKAGDHLDRIAQREHIAHAFLHEALDQAGIALEERRSESWHWYEFVHGASIFLKRQVHIPQERIVEGAEIYMPWARRPIRLEGDAEASDGLQPQHAAYFVQGFQTFEDVARKLNADPLALYLHNASAELERRSTSVLVTFMADAGMPIATVAAKLGMTERVLLHQYPQVKVRRDDNVDVLAEGHAFEPLAFLPTIIRTTIAFEAKKGESPEDVAGRIGIDAAFIRELLEDSPDRDALQQSADVAFPWLEFVRDLSFSREVDVRIPPDFIAEGTALVIPKGGAKPEARSAEGGDLKKFTGVVEGAAQSPTGRPEEGPAREAIAEEAPAETTTAEGPAAAVAPVVAPGSGPVMK